MARNYAVLPHEYLVEMDCLGDAEFGRLCRALLKYSADGTAMALSGNERFFANRVKMQEDRFQESYNEISATRSQSGKKGAEARWSDGKNGKAILPMANDGDAILPMASDSKNGYTKTNTKTNTNISATIVADITRARPSVEDVRAYCQERGNNVDAEAFVAFYESNGWKVGKNPMKDWKAAVRTWETRDRPKGKPGYRAQQHNGELNALQREAVARMMREDNHATSD